MNKGLIFSLWLVPILSYAQISCHIHPPNTKFDNESIQGLIGPFANLNSCEQENHRLYQLKGRCHCRFSQQIMPFKQKPSL